MQRGCLGQAVLHGGSEAGVFADGEGVIQFWNLGVERLCDFTASEVLGRSLDLFTSEPQRVRHWRGYPPVMQTGRP
jgi:PAS domain-containing protein